ncbi:hypothetical protein QFC24_001453 [Naganishia onofrii]|uniref:Uncharacterized protein n=1 Tax=Naganishia onofrii TaxID=1851511 RepID=A0ACC2XV37_9TREE|nr:hypothetical protein QFC24_001453 [Naganishia onofrii]
MKNHSFGGVPRKIAARPRSLALLAIIALVGLFLTLKDVPSSPLINLRSDDQASEADRLSKPKIDQNGNEIADDPYFTQTEIQRSFEEPDFALLSSKQPHEIGCDVPVRWTWNGTTVEGLGPRAEDGVPEEDTGVLLFLGVFSAAQSAAHGTLSRYRQVYFPYFPPNLVTKKFILGLPTPAPHAKHPEAIARARTMRLLAEEAEEHQDIVILDVSTVGNGWMEDNIDSGKTWKYYEWVAKEYGGEGRVKGRPRFVLKADDDTILVMPNLIQAFKDLDCSKNVYWGTSAGRSKYFGDYFRGLAYGMSWPLVSWIGSAPLPLAHITKIEDARTGQWLRSLDPTVDPIIRYDLGWNMGDWNQLEVGIETVGLHWLKWDEWVSEQQNRILEVWREAGRPYEAGHGVDLATSVESGKRVPEGVIKEHERQKELGWDVAGNIDAS